MVSSSMSCNHLRFTGSTFASMKKRAKISRRRVHDLTWERSLCRFAAPKKMWSLLLVIFATISESASYAQTSTTGDGQWPADSSLSSLPTERALAKAASAALERHYSEVIKILRIALREHPREGALKLELGRAYLATGKDGKAQREFQDILLNEPGSRPAQLELARTF